MQFKPLLSLRICHLGVNTVSCGVLVLCKVFIVSNLILKPACSLDTL